MRKRGNDLYRLIIIRARQWVKIVNRYNLRARLLHREIEGNREPRKACAGYRYQIEFKKKRALIFKSKAFYTFVKLYSALL